MQIREIFNDGKENVMSFVFKECLVRNEILVPSPPLISLECICCEA